MCYVSKHKPNIVYYVECDECGDFHAESWDGACRPSTPRFTPEELDEKHGRLGWQLDSFAELEWVDDEVEVPHKVAA
jgi:hypothetical protein